MPQGQARSEAPRQGSLHQAQAPPEAQARSIRRQQERLEMRTSIKLRTAAAALVLLLALAGSASAAEFEKYEIESVSASLSGTQAGEHADVTVAFSLSETEGKPYAQTRD